MLIALLLILLIAVILFREEIRVLIGVGILVFLVQGLWHEEAWWGKPAVIGLGAILVLAFIAGAVNAWVEERQKAQKANVVAPPQALPQVPSMPDPYAGLTIDNGWFCLVDGREYGPMKKEKLIDLLARGEIPPDTPVKCLNSPWQPANQVISFKKR